MATVRPVTYLDWSVFEQDTRRLASRIAASGLEFDAILAINRGGAVTGVMLSHMLDIRDFLTFSIQLTVTSEPDAPRTPPLVIGDEVLARLAGKRVLLADDVVGSGETLIVARDKLAPHGVTSLHTSATIWNRERHRVCPADFFGGTAPGWVMLPWE